MVVVIHYSEIALKGKNRPSFENKLIENIKAKVKVKSSRKDMARIVIETDDSENKIKYFLQRTPGISKFAFAKKVPKDPSKIFEEFELWIKSQEKDTPISIEVKRSDKTFPLTSFEITQQLIKIAKSSGVAVRFKEASKTFFVEIATDVYIFDEVYRGMGGIPVGTSGKALSLFSGGIDSPVASYLAIKRGLHVDFIHFHTFPDNKAVMETKIPRIVKILADFIPGKVKLYLVPYHWFQFAFANSGRYELVLFKLFMRKVAEKVAISGGYDLLVTGESLGQVASQTVQNLKTVWEGSKPLVIQPLISFDKQEIIDLAKKIGTYELSIEEYKDCCSIVSRNPATAVKPEKIESVNLDPVVEKTLQEIEVFEIEGNYIS